MKKLFTAFLAFVIIIPLFAGEPEIKNFKNSPLLRSGDIKNFRFGVTALTSLNWYKPDNLKKFSNDGSVFRFGVLINGEYSFSDNFAIGFGIGLGAAGGKVDFTGSSKQDTVEYYYNDDQGMLSAIADTTSLNGKWEHFRLISRSYNASYYTLPISLKMRTNEIGYMRYFFEPRLNIGIRNKVRVNDNVFSLKSGQSSNQKDLDITSDMALLRMGVTLSGGGEYYLSGSTALIFSIGYEYGLTNVVSKTSDYLYRSSTSTSTEPQPLEQKFMQGGVVLSIGMLF